LRAWTDREKAKASWKYGVLSHTWKKTGLGSIVAVIGFSFRAVGADDQGLIFAMFWDGMAPRKAMYLDVRVCQS
jgi:hypothetical protein